MNGKGSAIKGLALLGACTYVTTAVKGMVVGRLPCMTRRCIMCFFVVVLLKKINTTGGQVYEYMGDVATIDGCHPGASGGRMYGQSHDSIRLERVGQSTRRSPRPEIQSLYHEWNPARVPDWLSSPHVFFFYFYLHMFSI